MSLFTILRDDDSTAVEILRRKIIIGGARSGCFKAQRSAAMNCDGSDESRMLLGDLWACKDKHKPGVYILPKKFDDEVARLHLKKIGVKLTKLTPKQSEYLGLPIDGPYKSEHYR